MAKIQLFWLLFLTDLRHFREVSSQRLWYNAPSFCSAVDGTDGEDVQHLPWRLRLDHRAGWCCSRPSGGHAYTGKVGGWVVDMIRIGTRGSKLAMWQAEWVATALQQRGNEVELVPISTAGDRSKASLSQVGGQGLFTKEIQQSLLDDEVDLAVHSLKDLPTIPVPGLRLAAVPDRETTLDCLISRDGSPFEELPARARIGTGSSRRGAQLLAWRPEVSVVDIRGNVDSRLRKLEEGQYDAIVLAAAGLTRLKLYARVSQELPQDRVLPAIGQGALGLECRADDEPTQKAVAALNDPASMAAVTAERALLASLLAGCLAPVAALARVQADTLSLKARVLSPDGSRLIEGQEDGDSHSAKLIGERLARQLAAQGAAELIDLARHS